MNFNWCFRVRCSIQISLILLSYCSIFIVSANGADDNNCKLDNLKVACGVKYKDVMDVTLSTIPCQCTSIIMKDSDYTDDEYNAMFKEPPSIPVYLVIDSITYKNWLQLFETGPLDLFTFTQKIDQYCLAGIIFDNLYPITEPFIPRRVVTQGILDMFQGLRDYYRIKQKEIILGIALPFDLELVRYPLPSCTIVSKVDVFLWSTSKMRNFTACTVCQKMVHRQEIIAKATEFDQFGFTCIPKYKIVMEVNLFVLDDKNNQISYEESCGLCAGAEVALNPINNIQTMGQLVYNYKFAGGYLRFVNLDDVHGTCCCNMSPRFPGLNAFIAGTQNVAKCMSCLSYGVPGIHKNGNTICPNCINFDVCLNTALADCKP